MSVRDQNESILPPTSTATDTSQTPAVAEMNDREHNEYDQAQFQWQPLVDCTLTCKPKASGCLLGLQIRKFIATLFDIQKTSHTAEDNNIYYRFGATIKLDDCESKKLCIFMMLITCKMYISHHKLYIYHVHM